MAHIVDPFDVNKAINTETDKVEGAIRFGTLPADPSAPTVAEVERMQIIGYGSFNTEQGEAK